MCQPCNLSGRLARWGMQRYLLTPPQCGHSFIAHTLCKMGIVGGGKMALHHPDIQHSEAEFCPLVFLCHSVSLVYLYCDSSTIPLICFPLFLQQPIPRPCCTPCLRMLPLLYSTSGCYLPRPCYTPCLRMLPLVYLVPLDVNPPPWPCISGCYLPRPSSSPQPRLCSVCR